MAEEKTEVSTNDEPKVVITPDTKEVAKSYGKTSKKATRGTLDKI